MARKLYQKSIGFTVDVFQDLEQLKVTHSINMSAFVNNATREAIRKLKGVSGEESEK